MTIRHADGVCANTDGYLCDNGKLYAAIGGCIWPDSRVYIMHCYCYCHFRPLENPIEPEHDYLSTGCLHGHHDYCQATGRMVNQDGEWQTKEPGECKFCTAKCRCDCHQETP